MILATLCYVQDGKKTLMIHRNKREDDIHKGKWNGLGGKFESGESPEECVIREVKEEAGLTIVDPHLCGFLTFSDFHADDWYVFVYTATDFSGTLTESNEGELAWQEDLLSLNLWSSDKYFLEWIKEGKFFSAKFEYDGERLLNHSVVFY